MAWQASFLADGESVADRAQAMPFRSLKNALRQSIPFTRKGKLCALALVGSGQRLCQLPQVPTVAKLGLAKLNARGWTGVVLRQSMPPAVVAQLHAAVVKAVQPPEVMERFGDFVVTAVLQSPAGFSRFIQPEQNQVLVDGLWLCRPDHPHPG